MKKRKFAILSTILSLVVLFSFTNCNKTDEAFPKKEYTYQKNVFRLNNLASSSKYNFKDSDNSGLVIVESEGFYSLFNLNTRDFVAGTDTSDRIYKAENGLFYSVDENGSYTLYSLSGAEVVGEGSISDGVFTKKDGSRVYLNENEELVTESNPFSRLFIADMQIGDYYLTRNNSSLIFFDKNGKEIRAFNVSTELKLTKTTEILAMWWLENKLFIQTREQLPFDTTEYDIFDGEEKYNVNTYSYDIKTGKLNTLKNFAYIVSHQIFTSEKNVILKVSEIIDKSIVAEPYLQSFNEKGEIDTDIQKLAPRAKDFYYDAISGYTTLKCIDGTTYIFDGGEKVAKFNSFVFNDWKILGRAIYSYNQESGLLQIREIANLENCTRITDVTEISVMNNNNIFYITKNYKLGLFNTYSFSQQHVLSYSNETAIDFDDDKAIVTTIEPEATKVKFYFDDGNMLEVSKNYTTAQYYSQNGSYEIVISKDKDGAYSYYLISNTRTY